MTVNEILNESSFINMSLSNLDIYNESIAELATKGIFAVVRMINKFIAWVQNTVIPFLRKIAKAIADLLKKTKLGRKLFDKIDERKNAKKRAEQESERKKQEDEEERELAEERERLSKIKRSVLRYPTWLNFIAHSLINPNAVMKLANSTEDRADDINDLEEKINKHISDGNETKTIIGFEPAKEEAIEQLETMEKAVIAFESNANAIVKKCEDLKKQLEGKTDQGAAMRAKNTGAVLQLITRKTAEAINLSSENILRLQKVIDPFRNI